MTAGCQTIMNGWQENSDAPLTTSFLNFARSLLNSARRTETGSSKSAFCANANTSRRHQKNKAGALSLGGIRKKMNAVAMPRAAMPPHPQPHPYHPLVPMLTHLGHRKRTSSNDGMRPIRIKWGKAKRKKLFPQRCDAPTVWKRSLPALIGTSKTNLLTGPGAIRPRG